MSEAGRAGGLPGENRNTQVPVDRTSPRLAELPRPPRPWYAQIAGQWPLAVTLLGVGMGIMIMGASFWRRGATLIGLTVAGASVLRLVLPARMIGLLEVRSRWVDTLILLLIGVGILVTAWVVPPIRK